MSKKDVQRSAKDEEIARRYHASEPKQFGNLHERMRFLLKLVREQELWKTHHDISVAINDLETEIESTEPPDPPIGHRIAQPGSRRPGQPPVN